MREFDGLKLLVKFYENHGQLKQVAEKTGVPISRIQAWLDGGELSEENRGLLSKDIDPAFTGTIEVG